MVDAIVQGVQVITRGTRINVSVDWEDMNDQSFSLQSASAEMYDEDGVIVETSRGATISAGLLGRKRTLVTFSASETNNLNALKYYYILWTLDFTDSQTRKVRQAVRVRNQ